MATEVVMPKMGYDMTEGTILRWAKHEGDAVARGEVLGEIETGKVNIEIEAFDAGIVRRILVGEGQTVPVGTPIALIGTADEVLPEPPGKAGLGVPMPAELGDGRANGQAKVPVSGAGAAAGPGSGTAVGSGSGSETGLASGQPSGPLSGQPSTSTLGAPTDSAAGADDGSRLRASPLARRLADEHHLDLHAVNGSGPSGRVVRDDVLAAIETRTEVPQAPVPAVAPTALPGVAPVPVLVPAVAPVGVPAVAPTTGLVSAPAIELPGETTREPLSRMRLTIARRLTESWTAAPHIFLTMAIRMDQALALRQQVNDSLAARGGGKVSVNDLVVKAAALALRAHPRMNASWDDGSRILHPHVNVGVAVALPDGLVVITVPDADLRPLAGLAAEVATKSQRAREGKLLPEDVAVASTFSVSNLGMYGIEHFTAILNPPEAAILAVGAATPTPVAEDGAVVVRSVMHVTLSADHRVVDGATAAEFLVTMRDLLEHPLAMLV